MLEGCTADELLLDLVEANNLSKISVNFARKFEISRIQKQYNLLSVCLNFKIVEKYFKDRKLYK